METRATVFLDNVDDAVEQVIRRTGGDIRLGLPLGLGKPNRFVNLLYRRAADDPSIRLTIYTALSLSRPRPSSDMEHRFLDPFLQRVFDDYEELDYVGPQKKSALPDNIRVREFFFAPGSMLGSATAQQDYISTNYTHVARDLNAAGVNVVAQLVASRGQGDERRLSLASNPEVSLDLRPLLLARRRAGETILAIAQTHEDMPFMGNDAEIEPDWFDMLIDDPTAHTRLFGTPNMPVTLQDHFVGLHASTLVRDGGTLQIGIGALGDALVHHLLTRHHDNALYAEMLRVLGQAGRFGNEVREVGGTDVFEQGLYGCSEMFTQGLMTLVDGDVIRRRVYADENLQRLLNEGRLDEKVDETTLAALREAGVIDRCLDDAELDWLHHFGVFREPVALEDGQLQLPHDVTVENDLDNPATREALKVVLGERLSGGIRMHGGFFLGPGAFYRRLKHLEEELRDEINMTHISYVNHLYGDEEIKRLQRRQARFINTAFNATLLGAVVSDQLDDGRVLSGVGGQYNFVSQAHELDDARSVIMLRSWRERGGKPQSNIVLAYGHNTIPRHLRDMVVTEYGIADLRGRSDAECVAAMLNIADSRFQQSLLEEAQAVGKIPRDYTIPEPYRHNTPENLAEVAEQFRQREAFPPYPLGTDFTAVEQDLLAALTWLKEKAGRRRFLELGRKALFEDDQATVFAEHLKRMDLEESDGIKQRLYRRLLLAALSQTA